MIYLTNAFSLSMLPQLGQVASKLTVVELTADEVVAVLEKHEWKSCIGHADTAALVGSILERVVETNRVSITLNEGDRLIVAQYSGPRLPEGVVTLPEGARFTWYWVSGQHVLPLD